MIKEAMEYFRAVANKREVQIDGLTYTNDDLRVVPRVRATTLNLVTLGSLGEWLDQHFAGNHTGHVYVQVASPTRVEVKSKLHPAHRNREQFVQVEPVLERGFTFGQFMPQENFVIGLQKAFVQTDVTAALLRIAGTLKAQATVTLEDDGTSQLVTAQGGVRLERVKLPNPVKLQPFRTFPEVEQPASLFILRARGGDEEEKTRPTLGLFEVEDGAWRLEAMENVADKIRIEIEGDGFSELVTVLV